MHVEVVAVEDWVCSELDGQHDELEGGKGQTRNGSKKYQRRALMSALQSWPRVVRTTCLARQAGVGSND